MMLRNLIEWFKNIFSDSLEFEFYNQYRRKGVIFAEYDFHKNILSVTYEDRSEVRYLYSKDDDFTYQLPLLNQTARSEYQMLKNLRRFIIYYKKPYEIIH